MPYPNEHACRLKDPDKFIRFARVNCDEKHNGKCIDVIYGFTEEKSWVDYVYRSNKTQADIFDAGGEIQALRYPKDVWTAEDARKHCDSREGSFEAAKKEEK